MENHEQTISCNADKESGNWTYFQKGYWIYWDWIELKKLAINRTNGSIPLTVYTPEGKIRTDDKHTHVVHTFLSECYYQDITPNEMKREVTLVSTNFSY